jgi:chromate transporter
MTREGPRGSSSSLGELAGLFLKLGTVAFGGPAAHVAMMEDEVVRRRGWLTRQQFLDYLGATNLIPGPNSTELAIHIGLLRAGWAGLLVAGVCFILPAASIVGAIAWAYVRFGTLPAVVGVMRAIQPVVIAIVAQALWNLGRSALKSPLLVALGVASAIAAALGVHELAILLAGGVVAMLWRSRAAAHEMAAMGGIASMLQSRDTLAGGVAVAGAAATPVALWPLLLVFAKIGAVLFGSGYVLLAFLRADLVTRLHWITERQLLDAIVVGQVTPGPVFTTATFVGYIVGGAAGATAATVGIFLPAFVFVALSGVIVPRIRESALASALLDGVNVASLGLMLIVTLQLARSALTGPMAVALAVGSAIALFAYRVSSVWLVLAAAVVGLLASHPHFL